MEDRTTRRVPAWIWLVLAAVILGIAIPLYVREQKDSPAASESPSVTPSASSSAGPTASPTGSAASTSPTSASASASTSASTSSVPSATRILQTPSVPSEPLPELPAVDLTAESDRAGSVVVSLPLMESVGGKATLPGEVSGEALRVTIRVRNNSAAAVSVDTVVVNAYRGEERIPLESLISPGGRPFTGSVAPGAEATGVYLFLVDVSDRSDVTITVDLKAGTPASVFRGDARG